MEVEFEEEVEVGDVEIECPLCFGDGNLYAKKKVRPDTPIEYLGTICPLCKGEKNIVVNVGATTVSGTTEVEPSDYDWRD